MAARLITGRLHVHPDGYGFLLPDRAPEDVAGDIFLPPAAAAKAMHGDRVAVRITRLAADGRAEGDVAEVLERAHATVVGKVRLQRAAVFVMPFDKRLRHWIEIPRHLALPAAVADVDRVGAAPLEIRSVDDLDGMIVNAEILSYPEKDGNAAGRIVEVLGYEDDFGVDVEILIRKHHIPHRFPPQVLDEARRAPAGIGDAQRQGRQDFRDLDVVTIDGETARDFDDAVWVQRLDNGNFALQVHIADVSHYVRPGSALDAEALLRGNSVYFPDRAIPMLPLELSTNICSLLPGEERLVMSVLLEIDHRGDIVSQDFRRGVIRSAARMTYTAVHGLLEGDAELRETYARLAPRFELMSELALILNRKRVRRGSIDFDLPEALIEFDEFGEMTGITRGPRNIAHRIIEEFMLAANEAVAGHLERLGLPSIHRIHETPDPKRVFEFEEIAGQFGFSLGIGALPVARFHQVDRKRDGRKVRRGLELPAANFSISSRHYQKLVAKIEGRPEERILSYLMLRSLKQARYSQESKGHFALAAPCYTHFTSPIRRYPDLVVHRILGAWLDGRPAPYPEGQLGQIAEQSSFRERLAAEAERELVDWKKLKFMADRVGDEFPALIINVAKFGFFVELEDLFVEGLVPLETIPGDRYRFQENTRRFIGERTRREFRVGGRVQVRLARVNAMEKKLEFAVLLPPGQQKRRRAKEGG